MNDRKGPVEDPREYRGPLKNRPEEPPQPARLGLAATLEPAQSSQNIGSSHSHQPPIQNLFKLPNEPIFSETYPEPTSDIRR